jgi:hypothetical protein
MPHPVGGLIGLLEYGIGPLQSVYLYRTTQTQKIRESNPVSHCTGGARQCTPQRTRRIRGKPLELYSGSVSSNLGQVTGYPE